MSNPYSRNAKKCEIDGIVFASRAEGALYQILKLSSNEIFCQPKIYLTKAKILYKPDFFADGIYYEMKGAELASWRIKRRLWMHYGPGLLRVYKMKSNGPYLFEEITSSYVDES